MNEYQSVHKEYTHFLQHILEHLKHGEIDIESELHDLEWNVRNDMNRLNLIGKDAFEDEYEDLEKFLKAIAALKSKLNLRYTVDESTFDDQPEEEDEEN